MRRSLSVLGVVLSLSFFINPAYVQAGEAQESENSQYVQAQLQECPSAEEVFDEEQVERLLRQVDRQVVRPDKFDRSNKDVMGGSSSHSPMGTYPTRKGVILVTGDYYKGIIPTGHAAIIYSSTRVVESLQNGVVTGDNNWNTVRDTCYGVTVKGTTTSQDASAANWCYNQIGKPYNWNYFDTKTRKKFYCSHLVWAAFKDNYGIDLDTSSFLGAIHPLELVSSNNTTKIYEK